MVLLLVALALSGFGSLFASSNPGHRISVVRCLVYWCPSEPLLFSLGDGALNLSGPGSIFFAISATTAFDLVFISHNSYRPLLRVPSVRQTGSEYPRSD